MRGLVQILSVLTLVLAASGCGGKTLPHYAHRQPDGSVAIAVEEADPAATYDERQNSIRYALGDESTSFRFSGLKGLAPPCRPGVPWTCAPLRFSPVIVPGDGVADFFATVSVGDETGDLQVTVFIDVDWQDVADGPVFVRTQEWNGAEYRERTQAVDFAEADGGVYWIQLTFQQENNMPWYKCYPIVAVTSMQDEFMQMVERIGLLDVAETEVYAHIRGNTWGIVGSGGLGGLGLGVMGCL